ncbi:MAG: fumarate hydratase, partial [Candidatus Aminicenantes bacterium]|nr:fumarate hydratase [Candidatus Aminicenantes bacterium]
MKFEYTPVFPQQREHTKYRKLTSDHVTEVRCRGEKFLRVEPEALRLLAREAFSLVNFYFRTSHLENLAAILDDPEASKNDRFVAASLLKNAVISAEGLLPLCQDTGTANIIGYKGERVLTGAEDARYLSRGVFEAYTGLNLRASQNAPLSILEEKNTGNNLPAQVEIF